MSALGKLGGILSAATAGAGIAAYARYLAEMRAIRSTVAKGGKMAQAFDSCPTSRRLGAYPSRGPSASRIRQSAIVPWPHWLMTLESSRFNAVRSAIFCSTVSR